MIKTTLLAAQLAAFASAQPATIPGTHTAFPGNEWVVLLSGGKYGYIYANVPAGQYSSLSLRPNHSDQNQAYVNAGATYTMEVALFSTATPPASMAVGTTSWDCRPLGGTVVHAFAQVVQTQYQNTLTERQTIQVPEPTVLTVPFVTTPFVHSGGNLHVTIEVSLSTPVTAGDYPQYDMAVDALPGMLPINARARFSPAPNSETSLPCNGAGLWSGYVPTITWESIPQMQRTNWFRQGGPPQGSDTDWGLFGFEPAIPIPILQTQNEGVWFCPGLLWTDGTIWTTQLTAFHTVLDAPYVLSAAGLRFTGQALRLDQHLNVSQVGRHYHVQYPLLEFPAGITSTYNGTSNDFGTGMFVRPQTRCAPVILLQ